MTNINRSTNNDVPVQRGNGMMMWIVAAIVLLLAAVYYMSMGLPLATGPVANPVTTQQTPAPSINTPPAVDPAAPAKNAIIPNTAPVVPAPVAPAPAP